MSLKKTQRKGVKVTVNSKEENSNFFWISSKNSASGLGVNGFASHPLGSHNSYVHCAIISLCVDCNIMKGLSKYLSRILIMGKLGHNLTLFNSNVLNVPNRGLQGDVVYLG